MLKTTLTELYKLAHAADQAAPGGWHEDGNVHNDSGSNYRNSEVRNARGVLLDTLNADYLLTPDDRYAIGAYVAAVDPPTVMALLDHARIQDGAVASRDDEIRRVKVAIEHLGLLLARCDGFADGLRDDGQHDFADILVKALKEPRAAYEAARPGAQKGPPSR